MTGYEVMSCIVFCTDILVDLDGVGTWMGNAVEEEF